MTAIDVSLVVPLFDEAANVAPLHAALTTALAATGRSYEILLVDDGSRDATFANAVAIADGDARVRVVKLRRNFGQTAALAAGIRHARGGVIVTIDGDLQNDPADISRLLARIDDGCDLVVGYRRRRRDARLRVWASRAANRLLMALMGVPVHDSGCSLKAFRADLARLVPLYGDMHRFIPTLSRIVGARVAEIEVAHHPRAHGVSKYGFGRVPRVLADVVMLRLLLGYMSRPRIWVGWLMSMAVLTSTAAVAAVALAPSLVIMATAALCTSLALFLAALSLVAYQLVVLDARGSRFATLLTARVQP